ncbi:hypothetical protein F7R91_02785 [Streptomyces luteolifulvus]|uniref:Uncharacterized protein n=1 Tax=Streptomyces luteolifulvus TaxID=2615112 RepID=A0A6H9V3Z8_9ACTN|nr:hypothetical protein F7R91_02785 [Streptomyces luteolifulvus]
MKPQESGAGVVGFGQAGTTTVCACCGAGRHLTSHVQDNEIVKARSEPGLMRTWDESRNDARCSASATAWCPAGRTRSSPRSPWRSG